MNILVFTTIYPIDGTQKGFTPIVKYFCEDWAKIGHKVFVISSTTKFPFYFYYLPKFVNELIESNVGFRLPNKMSREKRFITLNGVSVLQWPIEKSFPGQLIEKSKLTRNFNKIKNEFLKDFVPDIALGHWVNPQVQYLSIVKKEYNIPTSLVLHSKPNTKEKNLIDTFINDIDTFGFRSKPLQNKTNNLIDLQFKNQFLCYSGVNDFYLKSGENYTQKDIDKSLIKICFVGNLIGRKFPEVIIHAVNTIVNTNFEIHYVGEGDLLKTLKGISLQPNVKTFFHGRLNREEVYHIIEKSDLLVMISKDEAFGLVYLEAMLNRTIPIAAFDEGFDGIIKNGINGYLCEAGNIKKLTGLLKNFINTDIDTLYTIQKNAFLTAKEMLDKNMAIEYLENIK